MKQFLFISFFCQFLLSLPAKGQLVDYDNYCPEWANNNQCTENPEFMCDWCPKSCVDDCGSSESMDDGTAILFEDPYCEDAETMSPVELNSLLFGINYDTNSQSDVYAEYEPSDHSRPRLRSETSRNSKEHEVYMYRLYENTQYQFFVFENNNCVAQGVFMTGAVPEEIVGDRGRNPEHIQGVCSGNYFILGTVTDAGLWYAYDKDANLVWWTEEDGIPLHGAFYVRDNHNIVRHHEPEPEGEAGTVLREFTPSQHEVQELQADCEVLHHGLTFSDGWFWSIGKKRHNMDAFEGLTTDVASDTVVRIKEDGSYSETIFDMIDFVDPVHERTDNFGFKTKANEMFVCPPDNDDDRVEDWIHINGISVKNDEILLSSRNLDTLYSFSQVDPNDPYSAWELNYRFGPHQNYSDITFENPHDHFYSIHGPELLDSGNIAVFDNGVARPDSEGGPYSRAMEFEIDRQAMTARAIFEFALPLESGVFCTSTNRGKVQYLENGNIMVLFPSCEKYEDVDEDRGFIAEVSPSDGLVCLFAEQPKGKFLIDFEAVYSIGGEFEVDSPVTESPTTTFVSNRSLTCGEDQWACDNGHCIPIEFECDNYIDCLDETDELYCVYEEEGCSSSEWQCKSGECIWIEYECDGYDDCHDRSDEDDRCHKSDGCPALEWTCDDGQCIYHEFQCDNIVDCDDESDEDGRCNTETVSDDTVRSTAETPTRSTAETPIRATKETTPEAPTTSQSVSPVPTDAPSRPSPQSEEPQVSIIRSHNSPSSVDPVNVPSPETMTIPSNEPLTEQVSCEIEEDKRARGRVVFQYDVGNEQDCCDHCSSHGDCVGWRFSNTDRFCELLGEIEEVVTTRGWFAGRLRTGFNIDSAVGTQPSPGNVAAQVTPETKASSPARGRGRGKTEEESTKSPTPVHISDIADVVSRLHDQDSRIAESVSECDDAPSSWKDRDGYDCRDYDHNHWCGDSDNRDYAVKGVDADEACCKCGGGRST